MVGGVLVGVTVNSFKPNHKKIVVLVQKIFPSWVDFQLVSVISIPVVRRVGSTTGRLQSWLGQVPPKMDTF